MFCFSGDWNSGSSSFTIVPIILPGLPTLPSTQYPEPWSTATATTQSAYRAQACFMSVVCVVLQHGRSDSYRVATFPALKDDNKTADGQYKVFICFSFIFIIFWVYVSADEVLSGVPGSLIQKTPHQYCEDQQFKFENDHKFITFVLSSLIYTKHQLLFIKFPIIECYLVN